MLVPPVMAQLIRAIGGPTGPFEGPVGPTGTRGSLLLDGATGMTGPAGATGLTGFAGVHGLDASATGPAGPRGPFGSVGYVGPMGPTGTSEFIPQTQFKYFENSTGIVGIPYGGGSCGCQFYYTLRRSCIVYIAFSGLVKTDAIPVVVGIKAGMGSVAGIDGFPVGDNIRILAPNMSIPFSIVLTHQFITQFDEDGNPIDYLGEPTTPWPRPMWFDISAYYDSPIQFDFGPHGSVVNLSCFVMEF